MQHAQKYTMCHLTSYMNNTKIQANVHSQVSYELKVK